MSLNVLGLQTRASHPRWDVWYSVEPTKGARMSRSSSERAINERRLKFRGGESVREYARWLAANHRESGRATKPRNLRSQARAGAPRIIQTIHKTKESV